MTSHLRGVLAGVGLMLSALPAAARAQQPTTITGRVTTEAGTPLQGASVTIADIALGTYSNADGRYSFTVPGTRSTGQLARVTARRIGYQAKAVNVTLSGGTITQDFSLASTPTEITGIVVTALGVQREKSQLGTAQQQVTNEEITNVKAQSVVQQLEGKVAGVQITGSGTPGGSNMITIRGSNSITGDNTPLFIVDGTPISKIDRGADPYGGFDFGSAVNDLNPDDIETMTVLKGPNAAALYGSRAANGVILITTKKGKNSGGRVRSELNTFYTFEKPSIIPEYQNQYGQGAGGRFRFFDGQGGGVNDGADQSWGPRFDPNLMIHQFTDGADTSVKSPWIGHPNNVSSFFDMGHTASATLAVSGGTDRANARLSLGSDNTQSFIPGTYLVKTNALLTGDLQISDRASANASVQYIRNTGRNRPGQGYGNSILESFVWFGRQVNMDALKNGWQASGATNGGPSNREFNWNYNYHNNPFFLMYGNPEGDARDRVIGTVSSTYRLTDWLSATGRIGSDVYRLNINQGWSSADITGSGADPSYAGSFNLVNDYNNETNTDGLLTANKAFSRVVLNGTFGGSVRQERREVASVSTSGISVPGIYNVSNAAIAPNNQQFLSRRRVNSVYGAGSYTWDGWWTVEATARNDWSSTLPVGHNSYFYPSANTSVVLTDALPALRNSVLSYLKVRASVAKVGNDASPYQLRTTYAGNSNKFNGLPQFSLSDVIANSTLRPEITKSTEAGVELSLFNGKANLDASVYDKSTKDQIYNVAVSPTTGFGFKSINAGRVANKGFEALLTLHPVDLRNSFSWTSTFNYAQNRNKVVELAPGVTNIRLGSWWYVDVEARQGQPYGTLFGNAYARDAATGEIYTDGGLTVAGKRKVLGNIQPIWTGGWSNLFTYKSLTLNTLFDFHIGGNLWSITNWFGDYAGVLKSSLNGREVDWNKPGLVVHGIDINSCPSYDDAVSKGVCPGGKQNAKTVTAEEYYQNIFPVNEGYVYKDTYVKLRELRLGFDLPNRWAGRFSASSMSLALTARNLWTSTKVPNVDPEVTYSTGNNTQGVEYGSISNPRTFGLSLRIVP